MCVWERSVHLCGHTGCVTVDYNVIYFFDTQLSFTWPFEARQIVLCPFDIDLWAFNAVVLNLLKAETL